MGTAESAPALGTNLLLHRMSTGPTKPRALDTCITNYKIQHLHQATNAHSPNNQCTSHQTSIVFSIEQINQCLLLLPSVNIPNCSQTHCNDKSSSSISREHASSGRSINHVADLLVHVCWQFVCATVPHGIIIWESNINHRFERIDQCRVSSAMEATATSKVMIPWTSCTKEVASSHGRKRTSTDSASRPSQQQSIQTPLNNCCSRTLLY